MHGSTTCRIFPAPDNEGPAVILTFSIILTLSSLLMIVLVLMHKGRGGGLSDMFGGGVSSSLGGSSVAERNLDRITGGIAVEIAYGNPRPPARPLQRHPLANAFRAAKYQGIRADERLTFTVSSHVRRLACAKTACADGQCCDFQKLSSPANILLTARHARQIASARPP